MTMKYVSNGCVYRDYHDYWKRWTWKSAEKFHRNRTIVTKLQVVTVKALIPELQYPIYIKKKTNKRYLSQRKECRIVLEYTLKY